MNTRLMRFAALGCAALTFAVASADTVQVTVNGNSISFPDAQPQTVNGHVLVPLRGVFEAIGATVFWDPNTQSISADTSSKHVRLKIGDLEANVNDQIVSMDIAPEIVGGSTLVPLRFLSQSLGATVDWEPERNLVAVVTTRSHDRDRHIATPVSQPGVQPVQYQRPVPPPRFVLARYSVIPLRLDQNLSSDGNHDGDVFTATVRSDHDGYLSLPRGTLVMGIVRRARRGHDDRPGELEVRFTNVLLPDGNRYPITGTVAALNDSNIIKTGDGRFFAKNNDDVNKNVGRDAAIGAGAGLVIGSLHARALGGTVVGGTLGAIVGALTPQHHDREVRIPQGTRLGLILSRDLGVDRRDL